MLLLSQRGCFLETIRNEDVAPGSRAFKLLWNAFHGMPGGYGDLDCNDICICTDYGVEGGECW